MIKFTVKRIISLFFVIIGMTLVVFLAIKFLPADPARAAAGAGATNEEVEQKRIELGLDQPIYVQYFKYMKGIVTLDMGTSLHNKQPVAQEIGMRLCATLELTAVSLVIYFLLSMVLGSLAAFKRNTGLDTGIRVFAVGSMSIPPYWLALLLQFLFYYVLRVLPVGYRLPIGMAAPAKITGFYIMDSLLTGNWETLGASITCMVLPVTSLVLGYCGITTRMMRTQLLQELRKDYIRTARSKGLPEHAVIMRHTIRNSISPILTMVGMQAGSMIGGTVLIEKIFNWPGLGSYAIQVIADLDIVVIAGIALTMSVVFVIINFIIDILYVVIDPRVRLS